MSFQMRDLSSRRSSGGQKPEEAEHENHHAPDTAGLTGGEAGETARLTEKQPFFSRIFSDTWTLEILCWLLALLCIIVIVIVLAIFNGQPFNNWNSGLGLNTLINVVSQIAQTAVFVPVAAAISQTKWIRYSKFRPVGELEDFDKASRGPIDSLWLITKHPKWILVYLGAINTSLILLLGPFAQQSVSFPLRPVNLSAESGSIPIAAQYQVYLSLQTNPLGDTSSTISFETVPPLVISAISNGIVTKSAINPSAVAAECETGNCTFSDYTSLAVCSSVDDVTPTIQVHCPNGQRKTDAGCSYTVPPLQKRPTAAGDNFTTNANGGPTLWIGASEHPDPSIPTTLADFYLLFFPDLSVFARSSNANVTASLVALKFSLSLCLKTYRTSVGNGRTVTEVADTQRPAFSEKPLAGPPGSSPTTKITTTSRNGAEFYMEGATHDAFIAYLAIATFYGTYTGQNPDHPDQIRAATSDAARALGDIFYNNPPPNHTAAVSPFLGNFETAMSNVLRTTSNDAATAPGTATYNEIYISVDFRWLILPILSVALSLVFLVAVAVETRRKEVPLWKDGLGKVLCALEPETRARMEGLKDGTKGTGSVPVKFDRGGGQNGWLRGPGDEWWAAKPGHTEA